GEQARAVHVVSPILGWRELLKTAGFVFAATAWAALEIVPGVAQEDAQKAGSDHGTSRSDGGGIGATNSGTDKGNNPGQFGHHDAGQNVPIDTRPVAKQGRQGL